MKFKKTLKIICLLPCLAYINVVVADRGATIIEAINIEATDVEKANNYREQGNRHKAKYYYQSALIKNKNNVAALYQLAKMDFEIEDYNDSVNRLNVLLNIESNHAKALILRSRIYIKRKQWGEAISDLDVAEKQDINNPVVQMLLESAYTMNKNTEKAAQHADNYERLRKYKEQASGQQ